MKQKLQRISFKMVEPFINHYNLNCQVKGLVEIDQMIDLVDKNTKLMIEIKDEISKSKTLTNQEEMLASHK